MVIKNAIPEKLKSWLYQVMVVIMAYNVRSAITNTVVPSCPRSPGNVSLKTPKPLIKKIPGTRLKKGVKN